MRSSINKKNETKIVYNYKGKSSSRQMFILSDIRDYLCRN